MGFFRVLFFVVLFLSATTGRAAGWVEGVSLVGTDFRAWGWGCDRAAPNEPVWLHIWRDDSVYLGAGFADIYRESAVGAACGGSSQHGFYTKITIPENLLDWKNHSIYRYVVSGPSGVEKLGPDMSVVFTGLGNVNQPRNPGDVLGRDYFGSYVGHLGIWVGDKVYQMTRAKDGIHPTMSFESLESFNTSSKPWGAVNAKFPASLMVKRCYERYCSSEKERTSYQATYAVMMRARQIYNIGADYTATAYYVPAREGSNMKNAPWPHIRGMYRCDTYVLDSYMVLSVVSDPSADGFMKEVTGAPANWSSDKIDRLLKKTRLPRNIYEGIKELFI